ncbi:hypothetical protein T07_5520 [Trichinella nelsoni]|uniref:Uncharacterized protein n=1 Tax=Trichinella nelsoni TaxID=6336 RepID=A0A0V0RF67_9BILA|nr:hypothetical protein T07_5520 [Trichinella nelsoni]
MALQQNSGIFEFPLMLAASIHTPHRCFIILSNCQKIFTSCITYLLKFCVSLTQCWTMLARKRTFYTSRHVWIS